jgi:hydrogenase maturation factor HypF (carbamoyltransferase family)
MENEYERAHEQAWDPAIMQILEGMLTSGEETEAGKHRHAWKLKPTEGSAPWEIIDRGSEKGLNVTGADSIGTVCEAHAAGADRWSSTSYETSAAL